MAIHSESILHERSVQVADEAVVEHRYLTKRARFADHEIGQVVSREAAAEGEIAIREKILVEDALLPQDVSTKFELMTSSNPRPGMLEVVLIARNPVQRIVGIAE